MLGRIWRNTWATLAQTLLKWFRNLFGWDFFSQRNPNKVQPAPIKAYKRVESLQLVNDADYEFLFMQLIEGVAHDWEQTKVLKFIAGLESRSTQTEWVAWLRRFGERLLATPMPNHQLAEYMIRLGEVSCGKLGKVALEIGKRLLAREQNKQILSFGSEDIHFTEIDGESIEAKTGESLAVNESLSILPNDASLVARLANSAQIDSIDPQALTEVLIDRIGSSEDIGNEAQEWFDRANMQYMVSDILGAIASYDKVLSIKPSYHEAWYNRGVALKDLGRYEEAVLSYDKALEIQSNCYESWNNRGVALRYLGQLEEAIASYDKALELKPDEREIWYNRGIALLNLGRLEEAIASYDKALELQPDFHQAWNNRGNAFMNLGRFAEAIVSYDKALEIKPDKAEAWNNRGTALFNLNYLEEGILSYEKALIIQPDFYEAWQNKGNALKKMERLEEAILSYEKALKFKHNI